MPYPPLSRRSFLKLISLGLAAGGSAWLDACARRDPPLPASTESAASTKDQPTPVPAAISPTPVLSTAQPSQEPSINSDSSHVIRSRHADLWQDSELNPAALRQMLDASLARLTRLEDARSAWKSLFKPGEKIAIKVNSIVHGCTHLALAMAVTEALQDAGLPAEQITLYDRSSSEMAQSGYPVASTGGVQCKGSDDQFVNGWKIGDTAVRFSRILAEADALINIPILKAFSIGGLSFVQKNHYGSIHDPGRFHGSSFTAGVTGLNALDPIRAKTRLIIGDVLTRQTGQDWTNYVVVGGHQALIVGTDPVALDAIGLQMAVETLEPMGVDLGSVTSQAKDWLQAGQSLGLGVCDPARIKLEELSL